MRNYVQFTAPPKTGYCKIKTHKAIVSNACCAKGIPVLIFTKEISSFDGVSGLNPKEHGITEKGQRLH